MKWFEIKNETSQKADVYIFDRIGAGFFNSGVLAKNFINECNKIKSKTIHLHINSPGGEVFQGLAIYNYLKNRGDVIVYIEGLAASIASVIALAGSTVKMAKNSFLMIHNPFGGVSGDSEAMRKTAETLDKVKAQLVNIYAERSDLSESEISDLMNKTTWLSADEAKEKGFCDEVTGSVKVAAFTDVENYNFQNENWNKLLQQFRENKRKKGGSMDEILALLGVQNEAEVINSIKNLSQSVTDLTGQVTTLTNEANENKINLAIAQGKLAPANKDFAHNLLNQGQDLFEDYLKQGNQQIPANPVNLNDNSEAGTYTADELLNDAEKFEELQKSNPEMLKSILAKAGIHIE